MTIGVVGWFDAVAEARIRALWEDLADLGVRSSGSRGSEHARPHISFVYGDDLDVPAVLSELSALGPPSRLDIRIGAVAVFPPRVLYLTVAPTAQLLERQARVFAAVTPHLEGGRPFHAPGRWNPHITLATTVPGGLVEAALDLCTAYLPIEAHLESGGVEDADSGDAWLSPSLP